MDFVTNDDFKPSIQGQHLAQILGNDAAAINDAVRRAISFISAYLSVYDTNATFSATGTSRNAALVGIVVDVTLYYLHERLPQRFAPEQRTKAYDVALLFLQDIADGKVILDLPKKPVVEDNGEVTKSTRFRFGSKPRRSSEY